MSAVRHMALWPQLRSPATALLLVTLAFCLVRARDQPGVSLGFGATSATIVPADVLLGVLAVAAVVALARRRSPSFVWAVVGAAAVFCAIVLASAAANGSVALVSGVKLVELAALGLGILAFGRSRATVEAIVDVVLLFTVAADVVGVVDFVRGGGGRQASFLGEHDFAALATLPLLYGLALLFESRVAARRAWATIVAGAIGCILGAALASLVGLYLGAVALLAAAVHYRRATRRPLVSSVAVVAVVTAATLFLRAGDLGFLQQWFGKPPSRPGQYAASWSQRLIYAYVGGRVFLAHPALGTGWYGELPPKEFDAYLGAARRRFSDQPSNYFPPANKDFIPQQTWDQILYELGIVGALSMLALLVALGRASVRAARRARDRLGMLPLVWIGSTIGALAGEGFFGGTPLAASFWLVAGVAVAVPLVVEQGG